MICIQKEVTVTVHAFFSTSLIMPKEHFFRLFRVIQNWHVSGFWFHCFVFPDIFTIKMEHPSLLPTCWLSIMMFSQLFRITLVSACYFSGFLWLYCLVTTLTIFICIFKKWVKKDPFTEIIITFFNWSRSYQILRDISIWIIKDQYCSIWQPFTPITHRSLGLNA